MSFTSQVEALVGSIPSGVSLDTELTNGAQDVIRRVELSNPKELWLFTRSSAVTSSGLDVGYGMVYDVSRGSKPCKSIPIEKRHRAAETDSMEYATAEFPVYYLLNGKIFVLPEPGAGGSVSITAFDEETGNRTKITAITHNLTAGAQIEISQSTPGNSTYYTGTHTVYSVPTADTFIVDRNYSSTFRGWFRN